MVNLAKRMRKLHAALLHVRTSEGAAILPPPPAPQLTEVYLATKNDVRDNGARRFWRQHLQRLKFHNPTLAVIVDQKPEKSFLRLTLESTDERALKAIRNVDDLNPLNLGNKPSPTGPKREEENAPEEPGEESDAVVLKPQPPADPSAPSTTQPPATVYMRKLTLTDLRSKGPSEIWSWFQSRTKAQDVPMSQGDKELKERVDSFAQKSEEDRLRVKAGMDAVRKERAELKAAREAAERLVAQE